MPGDLLRRPLCQRVQPEGLEGGGIDLIGDFSQALVEHRLLPLLLPQSLGFVRSLDRGQEAVLWTIIPFCIFQILTIVVV